MEFNEWKNKIVERIDMTNYLVHLTKYNNTEEKTILALETLIKILKDKKLIGSTTESGFIVGDKSAVCFQDTPIYSLTQNIYYDQKLRKNKKLNKIRYLGFGVMFDKRYIYRRGGRPVIYEKTSLAKEYLPKEQWWRIVNFDLENDNKIIDWTYEREWRVPGDLEFDLKDIRVIVPNSNALKLLIKKCKAEGINLLSEVKSIINLADIFF